MASNNRNQMRQGKNRDGNPRRNQGGAARENQRHRDAGRQARDHRPERDAQAELDRGPLRRGQGVEHCRADVALRTLCRRASAP